MSRAPAQRSRVKSEGGTSAARARPVTTLPAQQSMEKASRRGPLDQTVRQGAVRGGLLTLMRQLIPKLADRDSAGLRDAERV